MLNSPTQKRLDIAKRVEQSLNKDLISAVYVGGSVCQNRADDFSDLELCIYWKNKINSIQIEEEISRISNQTYNFNWDGHTESEEAPIIIDGLKIDIWHTNDSIHKAYIDGFYKGNNLSLKIQMYLFNLKYGLVLYSSDPNSILVPNNEYPDAIIDAIILDKLTYIYTSDIAIYYNREDWHSFMLSAINLQKSAFLILLALNKKFFYSSKRISEQVKLFDIQINLNCFSSNHNYEYILESCIRIQKECLQLVLQERPKFDMEQIYSTYKRVKW